MQIYVSRSISQLKPRKSNGKSDHVLFAPPILASKLAGPFTPLICLVTQLIVSETVYMQAIPKSAKDPAKSANDRDSALASCISKLLEVCILSMFQYFNTSALQFKKKVSLQIYALEP